MSARRSEWLSKCQRRANLGKHCLQGILNGRKKVGV
nr:hypothetical protein [Tanacetum cinerariifolium]